MENTEISNNNYSGKYWTLRFDLSMVDVLSNQTFFDYDIS